MPKLLTVNEVADRLRLNPHKIRALAKAGKLPRVQGLSSKFLFHPEDLERAVRAGTSSSSGNAA